MMIVARRLERGLFVVGALMVSVSIAVTLYGSVSARLALRAFDRPQTAAVDEGSSAQPGEGEFSLWENKRVLAYKESLLGWTTPPMAVLRIDKVRLRVPVFEGTSDSILNRGAGWIAGTSRPGEPGNVGIAGHRDGFFRGLKDVAVGDRIEMTANGTTRTFVVDEIVIVDPDDVHVLRERPRPSLTLVTCYPFYFVGSAPHRYIVHSSIVEGFQTRSAEPRPQQIEARSVKEEL